jgi:PAS domain S-box-containing protein
VADIVSATSKNPQTTEDKAAWFASFPEKNPNPIVELDTNLRVLHYANPAARQMFPDLEAAGVAHPFLAEVRSVIDALRGNFFDVLRCEVQVDGRHFSQTISYLPQLERVRVYGAEITERRQAEEEQWRLAAIVNNSDDPIIGESLNGTITIWNPAAERVFGYSAAEIVGCSMLVLISPERVDEETEFLVRIARGERVEQFETVRVRKDGRPIPVSVTISPIRDRSGHIVGASKVMRDITAQKTVEERLRASLKEVSDFKAALDEAAIVAITDPQGKITYVNDKFCAISKYTRGEILGQDHRLLNSGFHSKDFIRGLWVTIRRGKIWKGEIKNRAKDESYYWVDTTIVPFLDEDGKPYQYVALSSEITNRKLAEERTEEFHTTRLMNQAEALRRANEALERSNVELQQFAYVASHDLQTPLRNISGFIQLIKLNYVDKLDDQAKDWIRRTIQSCEQMHTLIRDVLAYSRVDSKARPFQPTPLREVFQDAYSALETSIYELGGRVTCGDLPTVMGDRSQLAQLLQNLIGNGLKYHGSEPPHVHVTATRQGNDWLISVKDNGIGIALRHQERIFEIFRRLHSQQDYPGTGIGLAICRRVVHRHGGRLWVESEVGRGSNFLFTIPRQTPTPP